MLGSLARARAALPGLAGLWTTAQKVCVATFANGTAPSLLVLIWNPVRVFFFSLPPPIDCLTIAPPLILCAAYAVPVRATIRAITATIIAGEGRLFQSLFIWTPFQLVPSTRNQVTRREASRCGRLPGKGGDEALEGAHVGHGGAVAGEDQRGVQLRELADRAPVLRHVVGEDRRRLLDPGQAGGVAHVADHVAADRHPVALAEEDDVAAGVARSVDDAEAGDLVALVEHPLDFVRRALPDRPNHLVGRAAGRRLLDRPPPFHRLDVIGVAGEGHLARLADRFRRALVVGVDVGESDHRDLTALELGEDPSLVPGAAGVDEDVLGEVDVDRRCRDLLQPPDPRSQVLQWLNPRPSRGSPLC